MVKLPKSFIRLVTFDALHTIFTPRQSIHVQYSSVFAPYVGHLDPERIKQSFRVSLKDVQKVHPSYNKGAESWWCDVIRRTAIGAGANETVLNTHLNEITQKLIKRFSSREGYEAFDDTLATMTRLRDQMGVKTAIISNGDSRFRNVLKDLGLTDLFDAVILSEEEGFEKPSSQIFNKALEIIKQGDDGRSVIRPDQCLHVGDEFISDYQGALNAGWHALLIRRKGEKGEHEHKEAGENLEQVQTISKLFGVIDWLHTGKVQTMNVK